MIQGLMQSCVLTFEIWSFLMHANTPIIDRKNTLQHDTVEWENPVKRVLLSRNFHPCHVCAVPRNRGRGFYWDPLSSLATSCSLERSADPSTPPHGRYMTVSFPCHSTSSRSNWRWLSCHLPFTTKRTEITQPQAKPRFFRPVSRPCIVTFAHTQ